jgi:uncharacterized protein YbaP (TraB family)
MKLMQTVVLACLLLAACTGAQPSTPAIWRISDANNSLYLLASFHALKASDYPLSQAVNDAYEDAELLVFEIAPEQLQATELAKLMQQAALLPAHQTLQALLSDKTWQDLMRWQAANRAISVDALQRLKPWYVALMISNAQSQAQGFQPALGLDQHFMQQAKLAAKPSIGLERIQQQIALFDTMNVLVQQELLQEALVTVSQQKNNDLEQLRLLWKKGNSAELEKITLAKMRKEYPSLYQSINVERNQAWLPKLQELLDNESKKNVLVIVGTLHLLGPDGLVQQLQARGYHVERLK